MEIVDNLIMVVIPGALHAGLGDVLFWGSLSFALAVAGAFAFPLNRWLIARGRGHAAVHKTGVHGGPPAREVGAIAVAAALFGTAVLVAEAIDGDHGSGTGHMAMGASAQPEQVRGLSASADGMTLEVAQRSLPAVSGGDLAFAIVDVNGERVRDYEVEHTKRMHLILARRDLTGFWHLHPRLDKSGMWRIDVRGPDSGAYRVFADFRRHGKNVTLARDLTVDGPARTRPLPAPAQATRTPAGYEVRLESGSLRAGRETELAFEIKRDGQPVDVEPYLGAGGHLVALRQGDLAYLHVHPVDGQEHAMAGDTMEHGRGQEVAFMTEFPSAGTYRLFLQFKHDGRIHTAPFTQRVG